MDDLLYETYYDPKKPGGLSTVKNLLEDIKKKEKNVDEKKVADWLLQQRVYSLFKPKIKKFNRRQINRIMPNESWAADLVQLESLAPFNGGINYLLSVVDFFSRYAFVRPVKFKTKANMLLAFQSIFDEAKTSCINLQTDEGQEFLSLKQMYEEWEIHRYSTTTHIKASIVERFQKTLETKIFKYLLANNTKKYIDVLPDIVYAYNHTPTASLYGKTPAAAYKDRKVIKFLQKKFDEKRVAFNQKNNKKAKYHVGQNVRVAPKYKLFHRAYDPNFEDTIRTIEKVINSHPKTYKVSGKKKIFYEPEITPVIGDTEENKKNTYFIEKTRKVGGKTLRNNKKAGEETEFLVKNRNDPQVSNWLKQHQVQKLQNEGLLP